MKSVSCKGISRADFVVHIFYSPQVILQNVYFFEEDLFSDVGASITLDEEEVLDEATADVEGKTLCTMLLPLWLHPGQVQYQAMHAPPPHALSA